MFTVKCTTEYVNKIKWYQSVYYKRSIYWRGYFKVGYVKSYEEMNSESWRNILLPSQGILGQQIQLYIWRCDEIFTSSRYKGNVLEESY